MVFDHRLAEYRPLDSNIALGPAANRCCSPTWSSLKGDEPLTADHPLSATISYDFLGPWISRMAAAAILGLEGLAGWRAGHTGRETGFTLRVCQLPSRLQVHGPSP